MAQHDASPRRSSRRLALGAVAASLSIGLIGCTHRSSSYPTYYPPATTQPGYGQGQTTTTQPGYQQPTTTQTVPPTNGGTGAVGALPGVTAPTLPGTDPINLVDINWLRLNAGKVMGELIDALPATARARVDGIPFIADPTVGEVNAFAACDEQGLPLMAISDGLLDVQAHIAQYRAIDELYGTQKVVEYENLLAQNTRDGQPVYRPGAGFTTAAQDYDPRKIARQQQILNEEVAFVLGHELAHHHLGHTGCANGQGVSRGGLSAADVGRLLSRTMPLFNQPNEIAADIAGVQNLLAAGARRADYHYTEGGAVLTLQFFAALQQLTPSAVLFNFMNTHPLPQLRLPIVQSTANTWRATGGALSLPSIFG